MGNECHGFGADGNDPRPPLYRLLDIVSGCISAILEAQALVMQAVNRSPRTTRPGRVARSG
jgi:hypothetical protein